MGLKELSNGLVCVGSEIFPSKEAAEEVGHNLTISGSREDISKIEKIAYDLNTGQMVLDFAEEYEANLYNKLPRAALSRARDFLTSDYMRVSGANSDKERKDAFRVLKKMGIPVGNYSHFDSKESREYFNEVRERVFEEYRERSKSAVRTG